MCYITAQYSTIQVDLHENYINNLKLTHHFHIHKILTYWSYADFSLLCLAMRPFHAVNMNKCNIKIRSCHCGYVPSNFGIFVVFCLYVFLFYKGYIFTFLIIYYINITCRKYKHIFHLLKHFTKCLLFNLIGVSYTHITFKQASLQNAVSIKL